MGKYNLSNVAKADLIRIHHYGIERFGVVRAIKKKQYKISKEGYMNFGKLLMLGLVLTHAVSCSSQDCSELKANYSSYEEALKSIRAATFTFSDKCNTTKSSWVLGAEYYSCDDQKGYFILKTKDKWYTHKDLPKEVWLEFKNAESFGVFYNVHIRGRYQHII